MSKTFLTADLHFFDKNILRYEDRPFADVLKMNDEIVRRWNAVVKDDDTVFVLGDVSTGSVEDTQLIINQLKGNKLLVMGNHDRSQSKETWLNCGFQYVYDYPIIYNKWFILQHEPPEYFNAYTPYAYIYGHVHGTSLYRTFTKNSACVCVERWNYYPVDLDKIMCTLNWESKKS